jgi:hypothetical protein
MDEYDNYDYAGAALGDFSIKIRDLEERQRILKDRLLLIGENLIDTKENFREELLQMKKDIETLKQSMQRLTDFIEIFSSQTSKFAKKEDLQVLSKQVKMFSTLNYLNKEET